LVLLFAVIGNDFADFGAIVEATSY